MTKNYTASLLINHSPRKTRLIINAIRGKNLEDALNILSFSSKPKAKQVSKLLVSAAHNLKLQVGVYSDYLVSSITAEEAQTYYRVQPRARGSANRIRRRYARVKVSLTPNLTRMKFDKKN